MKSIGQLSALRREPLRKAAICEMHGEFESRSFFADRWSGCPECSRLLQAEEEKRQEQERHESRMRALQKKIGDSGIPFRFQDRRLQDFNAQTESQKRALQFAESYADEFPDVLQSGRCALFVGKPGTGKTHLAAGIGLRVMSKHNATVLFSTVMRAVRRVKDTWSKGSGETESDAIKAFAMPDLLILDEIGVQFGTDAERLILFDILNERYELQRPSILMSNLTAAEVGSFLGERIMDRLREDGGRVIVFDWESHRGRNT